MSLTKVLLPLRIPPEKELPSGANLEKTDESTTLKVTSDSLKLSEEKASVGAGFFVFRIINQEIYILLLIGLSGKMSPPKGGLNPGETCFKAGLRELWEETSNKCESKGVHPRHINIVDGIEYTEEKYKPEKIKNGRISPARFRVNHFFHAQLKEDAEPDLEVQHSEAQSLGWYSLNQLEEGFQNGTLRISKERWQIIQEAFQKEKEIRQ